MPKIDTSSARKKRVQTAQEGRERIQKAKAQRLGTSQPKKAATKPTVIMVNSTTVDEKGGRLLIQSDNGEMFLSLDIEQLEQMAEAATQLAELLSND